MSSYDAGVLQASFDVFQAISPNPHIRFLQNFFVAFGDLVYFHVTGGNLRPGAW